MSKDIKMSDTWGWGCTPQDYTKFNGFKHDNGDYIGDCYGLIFLTVDAAEAQAHALRNHDRLVEENKRLREVVDNAVFVCKTFAIDINSGFITKDKEFAVSLLRGAVGLIAELDGEK